MEQYTNESINHYMKEINETEYMKSYVNSLIEVGDVRELDEFKMLLIYGMFNIMI